MPKETRYLPGERAIVQGTKILVILLVASMVSVIWLSVFTRYVISEPISWGEQVAKYLMIWAAFLGASLAMRSGAHVAVDFFVSLLPAKLARIIGFVAGLLNIFFLILCIYYGTRFSLAVLHHSDPLVGEMSMAVPYSAIPVGCLLMLIQIFYAGLHSIKNNPRVQSAVMSAT